MLFRKEMFEGYKYLLIIRSLLKKNWAHQAGKQHSFTDILVISILTTYFPRRKLLINIIDGKAYKGQ